MQVASIVPVKYLHLIEDKPYHLCLLQECLKSNEYRDFYLRLAAEGKYVILDNGTAEGESANIEDIVEMCDYMGASEIVLPDVFFEGEDTVRAVSEAFNFLGSTYLFNTMVVPQGRTLSEWIDCAMRLLKFPITCLGIPKNLVHSLGDNGRLTALGTLVMKHLDANKQMDAQIHLLGCWKNPREIGYIHEWFNPRIRGVDSGIAAMYAQEGLLLDIEKNPKPGDNKPFLRFDNEDIDEELLKENIKRWECYCSGYVNGPL